MTGDLRAPGDPEPRAVVAEPRKRVPAVRWTMPSRGGAASGVAEDPAGAGSFRSAARGGPRRRGLRMLTKRPADG